MTLLKLIRFPNLLIVAATQYLIYYSIFVPFFAISENTINSNLSSFLFFLLVLTTMLIAAGGYIINDIVDYEIDLVNKPKKVFIGNGINKKQSFYFYFASVLLGFILSIFIAQQTNNFHLLFVYPVTVGLLYFYSTIFKKSFFIGNLIVALFCAFVPAIICVAESNVFIALWSGNEDDINNFHFEYKIIFAYIIFAFLTTLMREVVKDIEDVEGDKLANCKTIPIVLGIQKAKVWAIFLTFLLLLGYVLFERMTWDGVMNLEDYYFLICLIFPTLYILIKLFLAKAKKDFSHLSFCIKILMLLGLLYLPFI